MRRKLLVCAAATLASTAWTGDDAFTIEAIKVNVAAGWTPAQIEEICPNFGSAAAPRNHARLP